MISAWWLLLIIPASFWAGLVTFALVAVGRDNEDN